jgi:hypothetical protein
MPLDSLYLINSPKKSDIDFLISFSDNLTVDEYTTNYYSKQKRLTSRF